MSSSEFLQDHTSQLPSYGEFGQSQAGLHNAAHRADSLSRMTTIGRDVPTAPAAISMEAHAADVARGISRLPDGHVTEQMRSFDEELLSSQHVFLFVNPTSGGNAAALFMEGGIKHMRFATEPRAVSLWIWDITQGKTREKKGFLKLKEVIAHLDSAKVTQPVFVIAAGGDGTVMWCITELWAHQIDDTKIALGVVPYGTGNDFARALGWQKFNAAKPYEQRLKTLKALVTEWLDAQIVYHDVWEVIVSVKPEGSFQKIDSLSRRKKPVGGVRPTVGGRTLSKSISILEKEGNLVDLEGKVLSLKMCNYFSIGVESRIGIGFDRYRTKSQMMNKLRYGIEGGKKSFFKKTKLINDILDKVVDGPSDDERKPFLTSKGSENVLSSGTVSLIACNIPSFAAGLDVWRSSNQLGIGSEGSTSCWGGSTTALPQGQKERLLKHHQKLGDGILEFVSFNSVVALGLERAVRGRGKRVNMAKGPFHFEFQDSARSPDTRLYFQVDGEFFIMTMPETITIRHKRRIKALAAASAVLHDRETFVIVT